jgi:hypothetical protein
MRPVPGPGFWLSLLTAALAMLSGCNHHPYDAGKRALTFYVATNGNDGWTGRFPGPTRGDGPFLTVSRAVQAAREAGQRTPADSGHACQIFVRQGTYFLSEPLVLTPDDSGLHIAAYRHEKPSLSGGRKITGWQETELAGTKLWVAPVPEAKSGRWNFRELWVNGRRAIRARHPNRGYLPIAGLPDKAPEWTQGQARFAFREGDLKAWPGVTNAEVVAMTRWVESRLPVLNLEEKERRVTFSKRAVFELSAGDLYYIEGALELLDQPGEWCLQPAAGLLYYRPRAGETPRQAEILAPVLAQILRLEGDPEHQRVIERVRFTGLTFANAEWYFPEGFHSGTNRPEVSPAPKPEIGGFAQAAIGVPGCVWGQGVRACVFDSCAFTCLGGYGLELARGCQSNLITRCEFSQLGAGGLKLGETRLRDKPEDQTRANEVRDCHIHDGGRLFHSAIGLWIGQASDNRIVHNLIHDFYYTGISIGWTWGYGPSSASNNLVAYNHVHHIGVQSDGDGPILSDMGGIYTLGKQPGGRVINNLWHDIAAFRYGGWGIYFDEGSSGLVATSNLVYRTTHGGFHQHYGETNIVENNIFAFARDHQLQRTRVEPHLSFTFRTNIVYFEAGALLAGDWSGDKFDMDWNLFFDTRSEGNAMKFQPGTLEQWRERGHDRNSLLEDPLFTAPDRNDFRLRPGSPAFRIGFQPIDLSDVGPRREK